MADIELDSLVVRDFTNVSSEVFKQAVESGEIGENDLSFTPFMPANLWIFFPAWADHEIDDMSWLCADTFSWHPNEPYRVGYEKLVNAITGADQKTDTVGDITITYYQKGNNGLKVCMPDQESNLVALYEATGVAWYYLLDQTNKQFKLPREKPMSGMVVGNGELGIINANVSNPASATVSTVWQSGASGNPLVLANTSIASAGTTLGVSGDGKKSGLAVERTSDNRYLYFYVGNFEQDAVEQTAGLNAEIFNGKADRNLLNTTDNVDIVIESQLPTSANGYTWYRKYKSGWVEQGGAMTFPVAGTSLTQKTITFPIAMADTNYTAQPTPIWSQPDRYYGWVLQSKTTTSMTYNGYNTTKTDKLSWFVCGMAA